MNKKAAAPAPDRKRGSGVKLVYDTLRDEIIDLALVPGSLIDENQLSDRFGMSRTPIREALVRLSSEGLVTTLTNRSTVVSNIDYLNIHTFFDAITLMYRVTARHAAEFHTAADLINIRNHQAEFAQAVKSQDALAMIATNAAFHESIASAGRNPYFEGLTIRLLNEGRRILRPYYSSFGDQLPECYVAEHEGIIDAIANRDVEAADRLASAHADQIVHKVQELMSTDRRQKIAL